jgi:hypothetical protein
MLQSCRHLQSFSVERHASRTRAFEAGTRTTFRIGSGAEWSRAATDRQRCGQSSTTQRVLAGQGAHARRWPTLCEIGPLGALRRKHSGQVGLVTHSIINQRALETPAPCWPISRQFRLPDTKGLITKNAEMTIVTGIHYQADTKTIACAVCQQWFTQRRSTARFCGPRCRQRAHRRASPASR